MPGEDRAYLEHVIDYVHRDLGNVVEDVRRESEALRAELRAALRRLERAVEGMRRHVDGLGMAGGRLPGPPAAPAGPALREEPEVPQRLRAVERALLAAATEAPRSAEELASQAGYQAGSYVRQALAELVRGGHLLHGPDGYWLPP